MAIPTQSTPLPPVVAGIETDAQPQDVDPAQELKLLDAWWRAANYLAVGMIYLRSNPLLHQPLRPEDIKNCL